MRVAVDKHGLRRWLSRLRPERLWPAGDEEARRAVVANIGWQLTEQLLRAGLGFLLGIWLARYLGPQQFGLLSYAFALAALVAPLAMLGLDDIVVRNLVRDPAARPALLGTSFLLRLGGALLALLASLAAVVTLRSNEPQSWWLVGVITAGTLFQSFAVIELWFNAQVQARYPALAKGSALLLATGGKVALILLGAPLLAFAWIALAESMLAAVALVVAYRGRGERLGTWATQLPMARTLLKDSWPLLCSCLIVALYLRIDQVMLGELAGSAAVGVYSVAVRLAEVWLFLSAAVYWSFLPGLIAARAADENVFRRRLQRYYNLMALCGYAVAIPVTLCARWLVPALFGPEYAAAGPMLALLIWANLFIFLENARSAFFNVMNWYRLHLVTVALGALLNVALNLLLIPRYGGMGAALASCLAYWFAAHGSCFLFRPLRETGWMLTRALIWPKI